MVSARCRDEMTTEESTARPCKPTTYPIPEIKGTVTEKIFQGPTYTRTRQISGFKTMTHNTMSGSLTADRRAFPGEAFKDKRVVSWPQHSPKTSKESLATLMEILVIFFKN